VGHCPVVVGSALEPDVAEQLCVLQLCCEAPEQVAGAGLVHVRVCVPLPQVAEHVLHADQAPFTAGGT